MGWSGVEIGGWINWCQRVDYPTCPDCKARMTVTLLQMEWQKEILEFHWGDSGTAHVTVCPDCHRHVTVCPDCDRPGLAWAGG